MKLQQGGGSPFARLREKSVTNSTTQQGWGDGSSKGLGSSVATGEEDPHREQGLTRDKPSERELL